MNIDFKSNSKLWLYFWGIAISFSWLLPNHYPPWAGFHADAWMAVVLLLGSSFIIFKEIKTLEVLKINIIFGLAVFLPLLHYYFGLISFSGQAWTTTAYLLAFFLALLIGQAWEKVASTDLINSIFFACGFASLFSVNLQLQTWLDLIGTDVFDLWSMGLSGARPYANFGQPNQLATFLLWGLLSFAWAFSQRIINGPVAVFAAGFLLLGVALTQSRTAWLGLSFFLAATWYWRSLWFSRKVPWVVTGLFVFFWTCPSLLKFVADTLLLGAEVSYYRDPLKGELRFSAWQLFFSAALERPWFGYGWTEVGHAQLAVVSEFPPLFSTFGHSHNLFLDLVLWLGIPLGLFFSIALAWWFIKCTRAVSNAKDAILIMFLGVIGIHAMLELPLHYAYFLLPTGLVMGVLNQRLGGKPVLTIPRWTLVVVWVAAALMLTGIIRDYFRIEASFQAARFELARIGTLPVGEPPDVLLLTQLRERITYMRYEVKSGMTPEELDWVDKVVNAYPGGGMAYKAAKAFALNNRSEEAQEWLKKICKISSPEECDLIKRVWTQDAVSNPLIAAIPWPE